MLWIRPLLFLIVFSGMLTVERLRPKRAQHLGFSKRRVVNGWVFLIGIAAVQLIEPVAAMSASIFASRQDFGLFHFFAWHPAIEFIICVVVLDLAIYWQHVATHKIPFLWSFHRVHHFDTEVDVTTALRFHPAEIVFSMLYKSAVVILLGAPLLAVVVFEVLLNAMAMFNHANVKLPTGIDRKLRLLIVTPDMHVIHHSQEKDDRDRNFGFCLSCWDRMFASYVRNSMHFDNRPKLGEASVNDSDARSLRHILLSPLKN